MSVYMLSLEIERMNSGIKCVWSFGVTMVRFSSLFLQTLTIWDFSLYVYYVFDICQYILFKFLLPVYLDYSKYDKISDVNDLFLFIHERIYLEMHSFVVVGILFSNFVQSVMGCSIIAVIYN